MSDSVVGRLQVERSADGRVVTVVLDRPRCLDIAGKRELTQLFLALADDSRIRAVILLATHREALSVDVAELARMTPAAALEYSRAGQHLMETLEALSCPVIAAVFGSALGGGCELVLACDLAFCSEDSTFGQIETNGGVVPAFGGTWRLVRRVGYQRACLMIYSAGILDAQTARDHGLVLGVVEGEDLRRRCEQIALQIAATSRASVTEAKRILTGSWGSDRATANAMEQAAFAGLFDTPDQRDRMDAFVSAQGG